MIIKYGDAETINVIKPVDVADEDTKKKLDDLKGEMLQESFKSQTDASQEQK